MAPEPMACSTEASSQDLAAFWGNVHFFCLCFGTPDTMSQAHSHKNPQLGEDDSHDDESHSRERAVQLAGS